MMLFGNRTKRATEGRGVQRRTGTLLALLALLSQIVVSMLPMPAMAEMPSPHGDPAICHTDSPDQFDSSDQLPDSKPAKSLGHHGPDCPVCQAFQLLGSLVSPDPIAFLPASGEALAADFPALEALPPARAAAAHQARAPPPSV